MIAFLETSEYQNTHKIFKKISIHFFLHVVIRLKILDTVSEYKIDF